MGKRKNPETSLAAYRSLDPEKINEIHKNILAALDVIGPSTFEELALFLRLEPQRVWRRLSELGSAKLIHRPGDRKIMKSGRQGMVWALGAPSEEVEKKKRIMNGPSISQFSKAINQKQMSDHTINRLF